MRKGGSQVAETVKQNPVIPLAVGGGLLAVLLLGRLLGEGFGDRGHRPQEAQGPEGLIPSVRGSTPLVFRMKRRHVQVEPDGGEAYHEDGGRGEEADEQAVGAYLA